MKPRLSRQRETAMTLFEVGVVIAIVMILGRDPSFRNCGEARDSTAGFK